MEREANAGLIEADCLDETAGGAGGFGSTGTQKK
jgi:dUTPase